MSAVSYTENIDKSKSIADQVMQRLTDEALPPKPNIFSLWYAYYSGIHPEIRSEIDAAAEKGNISSDFCEALYNKYLTDKREQQLIEETSEKVQSTLSDLTNLLNNAGLSQNKYSKQLIEKSGALTGQTDVAEIGKMVDALVQETQSMISENDTLEKRLNETSLEMEEMRHSMEDLKQEVMTDSLTGLPNRKCFEAELKARASEAMERKKPLAVLMADIDHFKTFNDTFGHQVGDQVLRLVARSLMEGIKGQDLAARYGGEEFIIILPDTSLPNAEKVANALRERIAAKDIINQAKGEKLGRLSISLGAAQLHPGESMTNLIERADRALYKAKNGGRNCVVALEYDAELHANNDQEIVIDTTLV